MTAVDHAELKRVAEGATTVRRDANGRLDGEDAIRLWVGFHDAMTPQVAIALLSEIEGLKAERNRLSRLVDLWVPKTTCPPAVSSSHTEYRSLVNAATDDEMALRPQTAESGK